MAYLIDSDVFIQAKNAHFGFDFCPAFWTWLETSNANGRIFSVQKIYDELTSGNDDLAVWSVARGSGFFLPPDAAVLAQLPGVSAWASAQGYDAAAVAQFLASGDYYLIAHALAHGHTVVTHEVAAQTLKRVKIPNACAALGINCVDPFQMLRAEAARFVLAGAPAAAAIPAVPAAAAIQAVAPAGPIQQPAQGQP